MRERKVLYALYLRKLFGFCRHWHCLCHTNTMMTITTKIAMPMQATLILWLRSARALFLGRERV
jgi:hypothetical protein